MRDILSDLWMFDAPLRGFSACLHIVAAMATADVT
jgi:hypothetical protein